MIERAILFAAGRGLRMRPLTDATPKPLLEAGGRRLIEYHLDKLAAAGVREVVVNASHLAPLFPAALGDGSRWKLAIHHVDEGPEPLETGGGLLNALPLLGQEPFFAISADVWSDVDLARLSRDIDGDAHLVLVDNPPHHPRGDFAFDAHARVHAQGEPRLTYAGIAVLRPALLDDWREVVGGEPGAGMNPPRFALAPLLYAAADRGRVGGTHHRGAWTDVGTPARLAELDSRLRPHPSG